MQEIYYMGNEYYLRASLLFGGAADAYFPDHQFFQPWKPEQHTSKCEVTSGDDDSIEPLDNIAQVNTAIDIW